MEIIQNIKEEITIINLIGRLDTTNYQELEKALLELINNKQIKIAVNCSQLDYISSSGLRILLMGLKKISGSGGTFVLCCLKDNIREIFEISGFNSIFEIFDTEENALVAIS